MIYYLESPDFSSFTALNQLIKSLFPVRAVYRKKYHRHYLDTFDWGLFNKNCLLEVDYIDNRKLLRLRSIQPGSFLIEQPADKTPRFHGDINNGRLCNKLKKVIKERALLDLGSVEMQTQLYEFNDNRGKILVRIGINSACKVSSSTRQGITTWLELNPLRGYEEEAEKIRKLLFEQFQFKHCDLNTVSAIYQSLGQAAGNYSSKIDVTLQPDIPAHSALSTILLCNLDIMEKNLDGIRKDIDIEFLHDFRVTNRRSRSLVTQIKNIFPESRLRRYKNTFKWLSKITSTHRDLDVFLADFAIYENKIPHNDGRELEPLRNLLLKSRNREHKRLLRALDSQRFNHFIQDWREFLEGKNNKYRQTEKGMSPVIDVASKSIWKGYRKIMKQGDIISANYTFESIHKLRKDGKKLRYLLEAFRSLYPDREISSSISMLKKLQNSLGDIVDMHTQRFMLEDWKQTLLQGREDLENTILAIDYLESLCTEEEKKSGEKFNKCFRQFSSKANQELFRDLFR